MSKSMFAGGVAGAIVIILVWAAKAFANVVVPTEVAGAVQLVLQALVHENFPDDGAPIAPGSGTVKSLVALAVSCALAFSLIGCANNPVLQSLTSGPVLQAPATPQDAVNQANILITAVASTLADNVRAGITTPAERDAYLADLTKYSSSVSAAQLLIGSGNESQAEAQMRIVTGALLDLQRRVAAKANSSGGK